MSSSGSGKQGSKTGSNWESAVLFSANYDEHTGTVYEIDDDLLIENMCDLIDASENIGHIWVYKCPLSKWQITQLFFCHHFVVMETKKWRWSIEKNDGHILIQRSKTLKCVREFKYTKRRRTPVVQLSYAKGRKSMKEFVESLYYKDELNKRYDWIEDNCQDFAKRIFDEFSEKKSIIIK